MLIITSVDNSANIRYSPVTDKYYVSINILADDNGFRSVCEHQDTISDAIENCYKRIQGRKLMVNNSETKTVLPILV